VATPPCFLVLLPAEIADEPFRLAAFASPCLSCPELHVGAAFRWVCLLQRPAVLVLNGDTMCGPQTLHSCRTFSDQLLAKLSSGANVMQASQAHSRDIFFEDQWPFGRPFNCTRGLAKKIHVIWKVLYGYHKLKFS
jgi:hypothetical protein